MPLYEYRCEACDQKFELLVRADTELKCPACRGTQLERQLSVFAVGVQGPARAAQNAPTACGACGDPRGPGACSMN